MLTVHRLLFTASNSQLTVNAFTKICASPKQFKLLRKPESTLLTTSLFQSTEATKVEVKSYDQNPVDDQPLSVIAQRQAEFALRQQQKPVANTELVTELNKETKDTKKSNILEPYIRLMRLNNPAPILLTYWPGAWAILGAASYLNTTPDFYLLSLFALGAVGMRNAGCIVNDIWDRKIDAQVERTKNRPLASGQIGMPSAVALLAGNLSLSLAVLMQLDLTTQVLGACCLFPMAIYPAAKRFTDYPQAILGVTFNWGALMGWSAVLCTTVATQPQNILAFLPAVALYAGSVNWTMFYDTIYGFQDKKYDEKLGLKSTSISFQNHPRKWLLGFASMFGSNLALFGYLTAQEPIFYISLGAAMLHFLKQIVMVNPNNPEACMKQFKSNNTIGALIALGLLANIYLKFN